ncbi:MAG TPA: LPXTG cell wall anchor domain-containing protein [Natronosporangium sp.]
MGIRTWAAGATAAALACLSLGVAAPAAAQEPELPDLEVFPFAGSGEGGEVVEVSILVSNQGTTPAEPVLHIVAPAGTTIVGVDWSPRDGSCVDLATGAPDWTEATELECSLAGELAGDESFEIWVSYRIDEDQPGVSAGEVEVRHAPSPTVIDSEPFEIEFLGDLVADLSIAAPPAEGKVGDVVDVVVTVTNNGPDFAGPALTVTAPTGTVAVAADSGIPGVGGCDDPNNDSDDPYEFDAATELICTWESGLEVNRSLSMTLSFRIDAAEVGDDGTVTAVETGEDDPDLSNNTAPITITVAGDGGAGGELPVTGSRTVLLAGGGAAILLLGGLLYVLGRRRKVPADADDA